MPQYRFTGTTTEWFPSLGAELAPGETVDAPDGVDHPRLTLVVDKTKPAPAAASAAADTVTEA